MAKDFAGPALSPKVLAEIEAALEAGSAPGELPTTQRRLVIVGHGPFTLGIQWRER